MELLWMAKAGLNDGYGLPPVSISSFYHKDHNNDCLLVGLTTLFNCIEW